MYNNLDKSPENYPKTLQRIMLNGRSHYAKLTDSMIPFIYHFLKWENINVARI